MTHNNKIFDPIKISCYILCSTALHSANDTTDVLVEGIKIIDRKKIILE